MDTRYGEDFLDPSHFFKSHVLYPHIRRIWEEGSGISIIFQFLGIFVSFPESIVVSYFISALEVPLCKQGVLKQPGAGNRWERTEWTSEPGQEEEDKLQLLFLCSSGMGEEKATREKEQTRSSTTSQQNNASRTEYYTDSSRKNDGEYLEVLG